MGNLTRRDFSRTHKAGADGRTVTGEKRAPLLVQQYFRVKARQLDAMADLPVCEHASLIGSHREELHRIFLQEVLP